MVITNTSVESIKLKTTLKSLKDQTHTYFDKIWELKYLTREEAYTWLAQYLNVTEPQAHMSTMDAHTCKQVIIGSIQILNDMRRLDLDFGVPLMHPYYQIITK